MDYLLIDTSYETGIVGLFREGNLLHSAAVPLFANQSKGLFPILIRLLEEAQVRISDLEGVAVGVGPGSYTGMRVGAAIAKGIAYALDKPLAGVCSLKAFAPEKEGRFAVLIDARVSGGYVLLGECKGGRVEYASTPQVLPLDQLALEVKDVPTLITTPNNRIRQRLAALNPQAGWDWEEMDPSATHLGLAAWNAFQQGSFARDTQVELLYLRLTQAEIESKKVAE
jgi:tRNA threonylcarbamoyladenosine biosynthesis protein TsaB